MVPEVGLEPTRVAPLDFESSASANFTTSAYTSIYCLNIVTHKQSQINTKINKNTAILYYLYFNIKIGTVLNSSSKISLTSLYTTFDIRLFVC